MADKDELEAILTKLREIQESMPETLTEYKAIVTDIRDVADYLEGEQMCRDLRAKITQITEGE